MSPTSTQRIAVGLAFAATALSWMAVIVVFVKRGEIATTPLFGGLFMLFMAIAGVRRLKKTP